VTETKSAFEYLQARSSKLVQFSFHSEVESLPVLLNKSLYHWTIENLVKNGIDAMKGKGEISVDILPANSYVNILISDTGHGIPRKLHEEIFSPGFTTKKRGWGLGLSLVRRIVEEYHNGKIKVLSSGREGTVMQLSLRILK
jgi:signal transduction histidine kinase